LKGINEGLVEDEIGYLRCEEEGTWLCWMRSAIVLEGLEGEEFQGVLKPRRESEVGQEEC
jgi:hypothetical protein